jgi:hypothetical protein
MTSSDFHYATYYCLMSSHRNRGFGLGRRLDMRNQNHMQGRRKRGQSLGMDTANIKLKNNIYIYIYIYIYTHTFLRM